MMRSMIPYLILGVGLIVAFRLISEVAFFSEALNHFMGVIAPFVLGAIIAYILNLPCSFIQRLYLKINNIVVQKISRGLSVVTTAVLVVIVFAILINIIVPAIYESIMDLVEAIPDFEATFREWLLIVDGWDLPEFVPDIDEEGLITVVNEFIYDFIQGFNFEALLGQIITGFGSAAFAVFQLIISIIASIYFLLEKDKLKAFAGRFVNAAFTDRTSGIIVKYAKKLNFNFHQYIYTQTIDGLILGTIMMVVLALFGSPYFLVLGLILGILNYIPYFGSILGTAIAVIVVAFTQGLGIAAIAAVVMFIIQQIDGNVIQPKLMGGSFSLSPILIIISVTVGGAYFGVLGMLMAIPIVAIFKDLLDEYIAFREVKKLEAPTPDEHNFMDRDIW